MLNVTVLRKEISENYTGGALFLNGEYYCDTLEDCDRGLYSGMTDAEIRSKKVAGETAIPLGLYDVCVTYSPRFKREMPLIEGVPGFDGVRIHSGNTANDTAGCILLGLRAGAGLLRGSRSACEGFERALAANGNVCKLEVLYGL